jgi:hypothetical protein
MVARNYPDIGEITGTRKFLPADLRHYNGGIIRQCYGIKYTT